MFQFPLPNATSFPIPQIYGGKGMGNLKIGDSLERVQNILQTRGRTSTYEEEYKVFSDFGYVPEEYLQFIVGFDTVFILLEEDNPTYPVFKVYFKEDKATFIIASAYGSEVYSPQHCRQIYTDKGLAFLDSIEMMTEKYGKKYATHQYGNYDGDFIYPHEGLSFIFEEKELKVIRIFAPMSAAKAKETLKMYKQLAQR